MKFVRVMVAAIAVLGFSATGFAGDKGKTLKPTVVKKQRKLAKKSEKKPARAQAQNSGDSFADTTCTNGNHKRMLEIQVEDPATRVPCAVHYKKVTEEPGHDQVLWSAQNDAAFCVSKANEFLGKLQGWGWDCGSADPAH